MKFSILVFFIVLSLFTQSSSAQKVLSDGKLVYKISIESTNGEKQPAGPLTGATLSVYFTKDKSRTEMVSTPGTETLLYDSKSRKGIILKEYSGQKLMITATGENWAQKNLINNSLSFTTDNTPVMIAGYKCSKATAQSSDGKIYTVYFDPSAEIANKTYNNAFPQLRGLPVQYELQSGNLIFRYTLTDYVSETVQAAKFDVPKTGFRVMTYEENQQLKKGE